MIQAKIIADNINCGNRLTTFQVVCDTHTLSLLKDHKEFSISYRDVTDYDFEELVKHIQENPFVPIAWRKGCKEVEYFDAKSSKEAESSWLITGDRAIKSAKSLDWLMTDEEGNNYGITEQICNRLLEAYMYHTVLITATEWEKFFSLRCPQYEWGNEKFRSWKDLSIAIGRGDNDEWMNSTSNLERLSKNKGQSEIHVMALAEVMWDQYNLSAPKKLKAGEWHIPFDRHNSNEPTIQNNNLRIKTAIAQCERVLNKKEKGESDLESDIEAYDKLLKLQHHSLFEHCAYVMNDEEFVRFNKGLRTNNIDEILKDSFYGQCNNFRGFVQYRYLIENKMI